MGNKLSYIDLFAGAGGLSEGFIQAGYEPIAHVELDKAACFTLRTRMAYHWLRAHGHSDLYAEYLKGTISRSTFYEHIPESVIDSVINAEIGPTTLQAVFQRIDSLLNKRTLDLIVGGPPCQAYSVVGRARRGNTEIDGNRRHRTCL